MSPHTSKCFENALYVIIIVIIIICHQLDFV